MKAIRLSTLAGAALLLVPAMASAQEVLHYEGMKYVGGDKVNNIKTGASIASRGPLYNAASRFDIYCIDYDNAADNIWTAHAVTFTQATTTNLVQAQRQLGTGWGIAQLRAAAWLTTQFGNATNPLGAGTADDNWDTIHGAIWSMFSSNSGLNNSAYTNMATAAVAAHGSETKWDNYQLLIDEDAFSSGYKSWWELNQAFIVSDGTTSTTVTPEPSTYAMMGAGLFAVAYIRRRKQKA